MDKKPVGQGLAEDGSDPRPEGRSPRVAQWAISVFGAACAVGFIIFYPPANELAREASHIVFTLFFTPFLMEIFCVILGFVLVITWNNHRLAKEAADDWVYLEQEDPNQPENGTESDGPNEPPGR